jgi:hypothetical protein
MAASAHARAGRGSDYDRLIDRANTLLASARDATIERPRAAFFDTTYFAEEQATALGQLRRADDARKAVEATLPTARGRFAPWLLLDLAYAYARTHQPEAAIDAARSAIALSTGTHMRTVISSLDPLLDELRSHGNITEVNELAELIRLGAETPGS